MVKQYQDMVSCMPLARLSFCGISMAEAQHISVLISTVGFGQLNQGLQQLDVFD